MQVKVLPSGSCIVLHPAADQEPLVPDCLFHHLHSTALTQPRRRASEAFAGAPIHGGGACSSRPFLRMVVAGTNGMEMLMADKVPVTLSVRPCWRREKETIELDRTLRFRWLTFTFVLPEDAASSALKSSSSGLCRFTADVKSSTSTGSDLLTPEIPSSTSEGMTTSACSLPPSVSATTGRINSSSRDRASVVMFNVAVSSLTSPCAVAVTARESWMTALKICSDDCSCTWLSAATSC